MRSKLAKIARSADQRMKPHLYPLTILEGHLDFFGHVHHAVYLTLLEEARWDMITQNGYGLSKIQETGLGPVILRVQIKYRKELRNRQKITIQTFFSLPSKMTADAHQEIRDTHNVVYCEAQTQFGIFDLKKRKLISPPPEWLHALDIPLKNEYPSG